MAQEMWTYAMEEMSYPDVKEILKSTDVVLIPIGSHEKHGPHIPLATDSWVSVEVTRRAAKKAKIPFTPLMPFGYSPHHMGTCNDGVGSITLTGETLKRVVYEIGRSLIFHGFNKLIYVPGRALPNNISLLTYLGADIFDTAYVDYLGERRRQAGFSKFMVQAGT